MLRIAFSYAPLFFASWVLMGGVAAAQSLPRGNPAQECASRERKLEAVPAAEHSKWIEDRDIEDANTCATLAFAASCGVGRVLAMASRETAHPNASIAGRGDYGRHLLPR